MKSVTIGKRTLLTSAIFSTFFALGSVFAAEEDLVSLDPAADQIIEIDLDALDLSADSVTGIEPEWVWIDGMYSTRIYFGNFNGSIKATLTWDVVKSTSRVFVSCSEGHMGAAKYTVHNVVPLDEAVKVWVTVDWDNPIKLICDYLVVN